MQSPRSTSSRAVPPVAYWPRNIALLMISRGRRRFEQKRTIRSSVAALCGAFVPGRASSIFLTVVPARHQATIIGGSSCLCAQKPLQPPDRSQTLHFSAPYGSAQVRVGQYQSRLPSRSRVEGWQRAQLGSGRHRRPRQMSAIPLQGRAVSLE